MNDFYNAMAKRRSIRVLGNEAIISEERLMGLISHAVKCTPTSFNAQEQRVVLLLGKKHEWFWDLTKETLKGMLPAESFPETEEKLNGFRGGVGTLLIYQDSAVVKGLQEAFPSYSDNFPIWANQASGMLEYTLWTSLSNEGYGASLQHYTNLIELAVNKELNINKTWRMMTQIPFGSPKEEAGEKDFEPIEKRVLTFK